MLLISKLAAAGECNKKHIFNNCININQSEKKKVLLNRNNTQIATTAAGIDDYGWNDRYNIYENLTISYAEL